LNSLLLEKYLELHCEEEYPTRKEMKLGALQWLPFHPIFESSIRLQFDLVYLFNQAKVSKCLICDKMRLLGETPPVTISSATTISLTNALFVELL
jgi:hypothetical protein